MGADWKHIIYSDILREQHRVKKRNLERICGSDAVGMPLIPCMYCVF